MLLRVVGAALALVGFAGCADGGSQCIENRTALGPLLAQSPGGVSGQDLLRRAGGRHEVRLHEEPSSSRNDVRTTTLTPYGKATIQVAYVGGDFGIVQSRVQECLGRSCSDVGLICLDRLELPVQVLFQSEDGAFAEQWMGVLTAAAPSDPELQSPQVRQENANTAWLRIDLNPSAFAGAFNVIEVREPKPYRLQEHRMQLDLRFDAGRLVDGKIISILNYADDKVELQLRETDVWIGRI